MASKGKKDHHFTDDENDFLRENISKYTYPQLAEVFNAHFGANVTAHAIRNKCERCIGHQQKLKRYTAEQESFLRKHVSEFDFAELAKRFNAKFNSDVTANALKRKCNHQLKIKRGYNSSRDGNNRKPVGSLSKSNGYAVIKAYDMRNSRWGNWESLHRRIYREHHGPIPKGKNIVFLNNDKTDVRPENLFAVDKRTMRIMQANKWYSSDPALTLAELKWCELFYALKGETNV